MILKLAGTVEKKLPSPRRSPQLQKVVLGVEFTDAVRGLRSQAQSAADSSVTKIRR
jgi:hypothetical protein